MVVEKARSHQSVDWADYFYKIRQQCPWSYAAWQRGQIDITKYRGQIEDLGIYQARIYLMPLNKRRLKKLAKSLDQDKDEILWSHPSYGPWATPVACLIQQDRKRLTELRAEIKHGDY